jgi:hypothetical protein
MIRNLLVTVILMVLIAGVIAPCRAQTNAELVNYLQQDVKLSPDQMTALGKGQAVAKNLDSRSAAEVILFGVVYINATPEAYAKLAYDFDRLRELPNYLALEKFSSPPQLSDLKGFVLDSQDIKDLKDCKPDHCNLQIPASSIADVHQTINWSGPDAEQQVNQMAQKEALQHLLDYQQKGNPALGVYNDKHDPTEAAEQFKYMLSYAKVLPKALPDYYNYLLDYPNGKPANVENMFYWEKVKFGLKPTLRMVQVVTMQGNNPHQPAYTIAEKQIYSSHYFETALDLTYCIRSDDPKQPGFYLIMIMGSEQAGLTGLKGSIVRKAAVGRSVSNLQKSLTTIKNALEKKQSGSAEGGR